MIGLAFKTDAEFLESVVGSKQATEHNDHRTQMLHVGTYQTHDTLGRIDGPLTRLVLC